MIFTERRLRFRSLLESDRCHVAVSVYDPISARIAEDVGFEVGILAGSVASLTVLGAPDLMLLTLTEFADQAARICRAASLPLLVDADHGYGNALNVMRTVEELGRSGVAALTIEDTELPRSFSRSEPRLLSQAEGEGKMKAALAARHDSSLVIIGRTGAASITGLEDAIDRCRAYVKAGVDAIFLTGIRNFRDLKAVSDEISVPLLIASTNKALMNSDELAACGAKIAIQGHLPMSAAVRATYETMLALRNGHSPADGAIASRELMRQVTRSDKYDQWTGEFLD